MKDNSRSHSFPAGQALQIVTLAKRFEVAPDSLLGPFGLVESELAQPGARVSLETIVGLTERARDLTGEPGLGIYLGLAKHASAYGYVGFAAMNASTVGEALEQVVEFSSAITTAIDVTLEREGELAALVVHELVDTGPVRDVALLSLFVGWAQITTELTEFRSRGAIELSLPEPPYIQRFIEVVPEIRFDQPQHRFVFPAVDLSTPLRHPDLAALALARQHCQAQLQELGFNGSLTGRVRRALQSAEGFCSIDQVAMALAMSERTLKRRLAELGVTFTEIVEEERKQRSLQLLRQLDLGMEQIAERLGYATASSFARAFVRWTGKTPAAYRRTLRDGGRGRR